VVDADLSSYFDSIPTQLPKSLARRISDRHLLHLLKRWLEMPVEEEDERGRKHRTTRNKDEGKGHSQGAPISPLLANLYMRRVRPGLEGAWTQASSGIAGQLRG
jgi:retron-type reverse transcriptase